MGYIENCNRCIHSCVCNGEKYGRDECDEFMDMNDQEVKHGKWIAGKEIVRKMYVDQTLHFDYENLTCSNCGIVMKEFSYNIDGSPFYKFCPHCGAKMDLK